MTVEFAIGGADAATAALMAGRSALIWHRFIADTITPVGAAVRFLVEGRGDFLLESVEGGETRGRYSLLGLDPDLIFRAQGGRAEVNRCWQTDRAAFERADGDPLRALRRLHAACRFDVPGELPPVLASLVGYLGFGAAALVEKVERSAADPLGLPDMLFVRSTVLIVFDQLKDEAFCVAPLWADGPAAPAQAETIIAEVRNRIAAIMDQFGTAASGLASASEPVVRSRQAPSTAKPRPAVPAASYKGLVQRAQEYIAAGDIFQVVLAQRFTAPFTLPPMALYRALRRVNPSPFLYLLDLPGFALVGSSPEILVRVRGGEVTVRPIAGTRPRGATPAADRAAEAELLADPKERAEHLMLLDLGRNDVGRVAQGGSVRVASSFAVERYSHVMHIVSEVTGRLAAGHDALDAVLAGFPAGTVSGAPKVRACQIIGELEPEARGPYAGAVGYFAPDGSVDSCIVLRTAVLKDDVMHVTAGAGIVADSDPLAEQRECEAKAGALFAAAHEAMALANGETAE